MTATDEDYGDGDGGGVEADNEDDNGDGEDSPPEDLLGLWSPCVEVVGGASQVGTLNNPPDNKIWRIRNFCEFWRFSLRFGSHSHERL